MTIRMKRILWATDFSDEASDALRYAAVFARVFGAELLALHVVPDFSPALYNTADAIKGELSSRIAGVKSKMLKRLDEQNRLEGLSFRSLVKEGKAGEAIVAAAREEEADLIVMGKKGRTGLDRLFIGSVANQVLRSSPVPVLATKKRRGKPVFKKILVPTDFSDQEEIERDYAWELARGFNADIMLLSILELHDHNFAPRVVEGMMDALRDRISQRKRRGKENFKVKEDVFPAVNASAGIVDYLETHKYDLIVISTCGQSRLERFFLGSTTEKVIAYSSMPVFAIPPAKCSEAP